MSLRPFVVLVTALSAMAAMALGGPAAADAQTPPRVLLHAGGQAQHGGLAWEEWTSGDETGCVGYSADGPGTFPTPIRVSRGHHGPRFVLFRKQRPTDIEITAWHELNGRGYQTGSSEVLPYALHPHRDPTGNLIGWRVRFDIDVPPPDYLHLYAAWPDGKCGGPRHLLRTFAIKGRRTRLRSGPRGCCRAAARRYTIASAFA